MDLLLFQKLRSVLLDWSLYPPSKIKQWGGVVVHYVTVTDSKTKLTTLVATIDDPAFDDPYLMEESFYAPKGLVTYHSLYKILSYFVSFLSASERPIFIYGGDFLANLKIHMVLKEKKFKKELTNLWDTLSTFNNNGRQVFIASPPVLFKEQRKLRKVAKRILAKELSRL